MLSTTKITWVFKFQDAKRRRKNSRESQKLINFFLTFLPKAESFTFSNCLHLLRHL